jgi:hypothetical protein
VGVYRARVLGSSSVFTIRNGQRVSSSCGGVPTFMDLTRIAGISDLDHYAGQDQNPNIPQTRTFYCDQPGPDGSYANDPDRYGTVPAGFTPLMMHWDGKVLGSTSAGPAVWSLGGALQQVTLPASDASSASAVNHSGHVVGMLVRGSTGTPYLYRDGAAYDLNLLIPEEWTFQNPVDINDSGWIIGSAFRNGTYYAAVLLRPIAVSAAGMRAARLRAPSRRR